MSDQPAIDWPARIARALAHVERLRAEWAEAAKQRRCARYVAYEERDDAVQRYPSRSTRAIRDMG